MSMWSEEAVTSMVGGLIVRAGMRIGRTNPLPQRQSPTVELDRIDIRPAHGDPRSFRFGTFELDVASGELRQQGRKTRLTPCSPSRSLMLLLDHRGESRDPRRTPAEALARRYVRRFRHGRSPARSSKLREALGDSAENPRFVETLPRRGYRFIAGGDELGAHPRQRRRSWAWSVPVAAGGPSRSPLAALFAGGGREWPVAGSVATGTARRRDQSRIAVLPLAEPLRGCLRRTTSPTA